MSENKLAKLCGVYIWKIGLATYRVELSGLASTLFFAAIFLSGALCMWAVMR